MHAPIARSFAVLSLLALVLACDAERRVGPEAALFANGPFTPTAPSNLTATAVSHDQIDLQWRDNTTNESGFEVFSSTTGAGGVFSRYSGFGANVFYVGVTGLRGSTAYCWKVRAWVLKGRKTTYSEFSNVACATTPARPVPAAPTGTNAVPYGASAIRVTWSAVAGAQSEFSIERSSGATGPWTWANPVNGEQRELYDWSAAVDVEWCYRVIAVNSYGGSPPSNVECSALPSAPTGLTATSADPNSVDLSWTSTSPVEDGFVVRRLADGENAWTDVAAMPANSTGYHDATVAADTWYTYDVMATREGAYSYGSNGARVSTSATGRPNPPALAVSPSGSTGTSVRWSPRSASTMSYRVERSLDGEATWSTVIPSTVEQEFGDVGLGTEQMVCYRVYATNSFGESVSSTHVCTAPPAAPSNLGSQLLDEYSTEATWTDNSNVEDGFEVWTYYYDDYGWYDFAYWVPANTTSYVFSSWEALNFVVATKDGGWSDAAYLSSTSASRTVESAKVRQLRRGDGAARANRPRPGPAPKERPQPKRIQR